MVKPVALPDSPDWVEKVKEKAFNNMRNHESCAQSIVAAFMDELGIDDPMVIRAAGALHGGMVSSLVCGIHAAGLMVLGMLVGRENLELGLDGLLPMDTFKEMFHIDEVPEEGSYQTLGGFIMMHLGRIPATADAFEWGNVRLEVVDMDGNRVDKVLAMGAPHTKAVCMGRALMIPGMVGKNIEKWLKEGDLPKSVSKYGSTAEEIFVCYEELKEKFGPRMKEIPMGAIGIYTYASKFRTGLQQIMAGSRNFNIRSISRNDLMALTEDASKVSGIPYVMDAYADEALTVLLD